MGGAWSADGAIAAALLAALLYERGVLLRWSTMLERAPRLARGATLLAPLAEHARIAFVGAALAAAGGALLAAQGALLGHAVLVGALFAATWPARALFWQAALARAGPPHVDAIVRTWREQQATHTMVAGALVLAALSLWGSMLSPGVAWLSVGVATSAAIVGAFRIRALR